jgi:class 3 adenylate cyclase
MASMARDLPSGEVTLVFTDIEGSTKLLHKLGAEEYAQALTEHRRLLRDAIADVKAQMDPDVFRDAWERGKRLSIERAVEMVFSRAPGRR